ncbi:MAG: DNA mismatch repair endonuclease MutL [Clostridia bacterium]|nr:DNA mismatch repair endonuclease MutL [Clostridia bacterium]
MGKIVLLDELSINKIAAGEVIERPASVIKEMIENSIDAGATNITIEIENGGISYIRVTDNGRGISEDDLEMAFERHATSKIRNASELSEVKSMGFRGEALASIGAIANVELVSKTAEQENGYRIVVEGGYVLDKQTAGCPNGTSITVRNLFYNTPVRYKFLKKDYTESGYIEDVVTRIAQSYPEIAIKLINSRKTVIQTNGNGDLKTVIYSIYGKDVAEKIINVDYQYEDIRITGIVGRPEIARSNRSQQIFFVNKRYVRDKILQSATEQAFKGMIPLGKFPFLSLDIDMNPNKVDVNVHPAKLEVRFEQEDKIFKAVYHAIKETLLKGNSQDIAIYSQTQVIPKEVLNEEQEIEQESITNQMKPKNPFLSILPSFNKKSENRKDIEFSDLDKNLELNSMQNISEETDFEQNEETNIVEVLYREQQAKIRQQEESKQGNGIEQQENVIEEKGTKNEYILQQENVMQEVNGTEQESEKQLASETQQQEVDNDAVIENIQQEEIVRLLNEIQQTNQDSEQLKQIEKQDMELPYIIEECDETQVNKPVQTIEEKQIEYNFDEMYMKTFGKMPSSINIQNISVFENTPELEKPVYKIIGIAFNTYIILEMNEEMYVIDQHAAHERVLYEKVKKNYYANNQTATQMMLLPDIITLTHKEMEIARENMQIFERAGFILEEFGENTIKLSGVPDICIDLETKEMFLEALDEITSLGRTAKQEIEERFIATVACKAAVKANMALTELEIKELMDKLLVLPNPFTCPHGRPTAIKMTKYEIERKFARK